MESDFALSISLYHAFELLQLHGMRSFHQFLKTTFSSGARKSQAKMDIFRNPIFNGIMKQLHEKLQDSNLSPDGPTTSNLGSHFRITGNSGLDDVDRPSGSGGFFYSHPKLYKLEEVVLEHFRECQSSGGSSPSGKAARNTRVMIFSQYRESVQEIADMLSQHHPLVKVMTFVGHSAGKSSSKGLTQKEQTEVCTYDCRQSPLLVSLICVVHPRGSVPTMLSFYWCYA